LNRRSLALSSFADLRVSSRKPDSNIEDFSGDGSRKDAEIRKALTPPTFLISCFFVGELLNKFGNHRRKA